MTAHVMIASAMGRRNYVLFNKQAMYCNLYCGMVAKPGSGKSQVMKLAKQILDRMNEFENGTHIFLGNDSVSKASLVMDLMNTKLEMGTQPNQPMLTLHEMTCMYDELATFMPAYEADKVGLLLKLYDNPELYRETRVTAEPREIKNVFFNLFFGTQPDFWARLLAFEQEVGIKSRTILCSEDVDIYSTTLLQPATDPTGKADNLVNAGGIISPEYTGKIQVLARDLAVIASQATGLLRFAGGYAEKLNEWWKNGGNPIAPALAMGDYPVRRPMHVIKLSAQIAVSRGAREITVAHLDAAFSTLFDWEDSTKYMTLDLRQSEHGRVMDETYQFFYAKTVKGAHIAQFSGQDLRKFLSMRVRAVEIEVMVTQMIQSGYIKPAGPAVAGSVDLQAVVKFQRFVVNPQLKMKQSV